MGSVTQELSYGLGETLAVRGTKVSQLRTHTIQAYRAFDALMSVSTRALVIMQQLMKLLGGGYDHTTLLQVFLGSRNSKAKAAHAK